MNCPFCKDKLKIGDGETEIANHLVVTQDISNHFHVHGPIDNKELMNEFIDAACSHSGIKSPTAAPAITKPPKNVVFHNRQAIGDILTMTAAIRDFKQAYKDTEVGVITTASHIWDHNPNVNFDLGMLARKHAHTFTKEGECRFPIPESNGGEMWKIGPGYLTNKSNRWNYHMCNAYRLDIEQKTGWLFEQTITRPDIWMTEEEYNAKPLIDGPYWVVVIGGEPGWPVKTYPVERFQQVIDSMPNIKFVQLGLKGHPYPKLNNVIDFVGETEDKDTGIRRLFNIFLHAQGSLGLVSMHMHLSAAFNNPCVVIAGAREPMWFTHYYGHQYLETNGCLPCAEVGACWKCKVEGCVNTQKAYKMEPNEKVPPCVDIIHPNEVITAINKYYAGGRLRYGEKIKNSYFKNIAKEAKIHQVPKPIIDTSLPDQYGLSWGGGCITDRDWEFMEGVLKKHNVKTVLEFGAGLSTLLFMDKVDSLITYESLDRWIDKIGPEITDNVDLRKWDGKEIKEELGQFDLAFVDGPSGGGSREFSTKIAAEHAKIIIVHDAGRPAEREWQDKYIKDGFDFLSKGGHRCHLWGKKGAVDKTSYPPTVVVNITPVKKPNVRLISTARGWGGCARSITTIMKFMLDRGLGVEFVPFHSKYELGTGIGREFRDCLNTTLKDVVVRDYRSITEPCDITFVYFDDYCWEAPREDLVELFSNLKTDRKVMMLNYRRGKVGEIPWTQGWDSYMFLNSTQEAELLSVYPGADGKTKILPPCTVLDPFLKNKPDYDSPITLLRHSSQGDTKFAKDFNDEVRAIQDAVPFLSFHFMPGPSFLGATDKIIKFPKNNPPVPEFLATGNMYWYSLPKGYMDMGPRVILEAMASGLPVIADNWGGAKDRITDETGWLCNEKSEYAPIISEINADVLKSKGEAARQRAIDCFVPERWIDAVIGK